MDFLNFISEIFSNAGYIGSNSKKKKRFWLFELISILLLIIGVIIFAIKFPSFEITTISIATFAISIILALLISLLTFGILIKLLIIKQVTITQLIGFVFSCSIFLGSIILLIIA